MRRVLFLVLIFVVIFSSKPAFATTNKKLSYLQDKKIIDGKVLGDASIDLALDQPITRADFAKLMATAISLSDELPKFTFFDVRDHWARTYIDKLSNDPRAIITLTQDGYFRPDDYLTNAELIAMVVRASKKDLSEQDRLFALWPDSYLLWANEENLFQGLDIKDPEAQASRQTAYEMLYNAMTVLALENPASAEEFSEFDPTAKSPSFDWLDKAREKVEEAKEAYAQVEDKGNIVFAYKPIKKGDLLRLHIEISAKSIDQEHLVEAKIFSLNSMLNPEDIVVDQEFSKLTLNYSGRRSDSFLASTLLAYYKGQALDLVYNPEIETITITTPGLEEVLSAGDNYGLDFVIKANRDIKFIRN
ncbi:MAG: hypothetical protein Q4E36_06745 [Bacillota bacterium]|nr:hypothetical protein [Bacillota bacterium]